MSADWTPIERAANHLTEKLIGELEGLSPLEVEAALCEIGALLDTGDLTPEQQRFAADADQLTVEAEQADEPAAFSGILYEAFWLPYEYKDTLSTKAMGDVLDPRCVHLGLQLLQERRSE